MDYGIPMKKVPLHPSHRGTSYVPRAVREQRAADARKAAYGQEEETYVGLGGEEKTGLVAKRKRGRTIGESSPPRDRKAVLAPSEGAADEGEEEP